MTKSAHHTLRSTTPYPNPVVLILEPVDRQKTLFMVGATRNKFSVAKLPRTQPLSSDIQITGSDHTDLSHLALVSVGEFTPIADHHAGFYAHRSGCLHQLIHCFTLHSIATVYGTVDYA